MKVSTFLIAAWATRLIVVGLFLIVVGSVANAQDGTNKFITRSGDKLREGSKEFRFISFNVPNLHLVEDNLPFEEMNAWRLPDEFELNDALESIRQMGGRVVRSYVISVRRADDDVTVPRHVTGPGQFNEDAFKTLDKVLEIAGKRGIRVILPFVDQWKWWGGIAEYAAFRGKAADQFWTDAQLIADFKQTINFVVNRRNTLTGTLYKDDKSILAWETGNELTSPAAWTREITAYIKSLDKNHLVIDGYHTGDRGFQQEVIDDPNVDIVSSHYYPNQKTPLLDAIEQTRQSIGGRKAFFVGEFGFIPTPLVRQVLDKVIADGVSGALIWSLRFHNRDGGYYWHTEGASSDAYKAYHWPGSRTGERYAELELVKLMREKAYEIQGLVPLALAPPASPVLLPIKSPAAISWRGSAGAAGYDVERASNPNGPWTIVGAGVDDTATQYGPLFSDEYAEAGRSYYYRVRAINAAGTSAPSNIAGPVRVDSLVLRDEMRDLARVFSSGGHLTLESREPRSAKEDAHRVKGSAGSWLVYRTLYPIRSATVRVFFERDVIDFDVLASTDGLTFIPVQAVRRDFFKASRDYNYWKGVAYHIDKPPRGSYFVKLVFRTDAQIASVEIEHRK
ncbi:MAG TPA: cellulase family glycosylhydrolase [Blastocatellia bacterium]|nr:cellulase family glycosylhydrolase [Blastocatellia bacterium]